MEEVLTVCITIRLAVMHSMPYPCLGMPGLQDHLHYLPEPWTPPDDCDLLQEIRLAEESNRQNLTPLSSQEKAELNHSKTEMLLQLARWMAETGQGGKADVTGRPPMRLSVYPHMSHQLLNVFGRFYGYHVQMSG